MSTPAIPPASPISWGSGVLVSLKSTLNAVGGLVGYSGNVGDAKGTSLALNGATLGTNAFAATGAGAFSGKLTAPQIGTSNAATKAAVNIGLSSDYTTGLYFNGSNLGFSSGNFSVCYYNAGWRFYGSLSVCGGDCEIVPDIYWYRDGAGIWAQRNGANAQSLRVYNTWSSAGANYERGILDWTTTANVLTIGTEMGGTGVARNLQFKIGNVVKLDYGVTNTGWTFGTEALYAKSLSVTNYIVSSRSCLDSGASVNGLVMANTALVTWTTSATSPAAAQDTGLSRVSAAVIAVGNGAASNASGTISAATHRHPAAATFPASPVTGDIASVNTATAPTIGSAVALGGAAFALGVYNGAQWTCIGK